MKKNEIKDILINEAKKHYDSMGSFKDSSNPQVIELYNQAKGGYDAIDDIYYKLFHTFITIE